MALWKVIWSSSWPLYFTEHFLVSILACSCEQGKFFKSFFKSPQWEFKEITPKYLPVNNTLANLSEIQSHMTIWLAHQNSQWHDVLSRELQLKDIYKLLYFYVIGLFHTAFLLSLGAFRSLYISIHSSAWSPFFVNVATSNLVSANIEKLMSH